MAKPKKDKRFIITEQYGSFSSLGTCVLVDKKTGVNYLYATGGYSGGLTVLVDALGNPIVTPVVEE